MNLINYGLENGIGIAKIDRPEALNALNVGVLEELDELITSIESNDEINVFILSGEGRSFVAGADIAVQSTLGVLDGRDWGRKGSALFRRIEKLEIPTIAAVNGFALGGGCELAMAFDLIIASEKARFGQPEVGLGITPGFSGTQRLPRRVGAAKAKELIFTGELIDGKEAARIGLANKVVAPEDLMDVSIEMATKIASNAKIAVKSSKACIDRGMQVDIDSGIAIENELFATTFGTYDQKEGMAAFLEKRKPEFKGK